MDLATIIGLVLGVVCIVYGIYDGGELSSFVHVGSFAITMGGGIAATLISFEMEDIKRIAKLLPHVFRKRTPLRSRQFKCLLICHKSPQRGPSCIGIRARRYRG